MFLLILLTSLQIVKAQNPKYAKIEQELRSLGIRFPHVVMLQWREESGNGTSSLALKHNNTLGMKYPYNRKTTAIGKTKDGFAIYKTQRQGFKDYKIWQDKYISKSTIKTRKQYIKVLRKIYANGDQKYLKNFLGY